jgi:voltage-gated potassium channel
LMRLLPMTSPFPDAGFRLVIGSQSSVPAILDELVRSGQPVVLVSDVDPATVPAGVHLVAGDPTSAAVLRNAKPASAADALVAGADDGDTLVIAVLLREQAPAVPVTALCSSRSVAEALRELGVGQVVFGVDLIAHVLAKSLEAPHAGDLLLRLLSSEHARLVEQAVPADAKVRALSQLRAGRAELVLGVVKKGNDKVALGVGDDPEVGPGDVLLVVEPLAT